MDKDEKKKTKEEETSEPEEKKEELEIDPSMFKQENIPDWDI